MVPRPAVLAPPGTLLEMHILRSQLPPSGSETGGAGTLTNCSAPSDLTIPGVLVSSLGRSDHRCSEVREATTAPASVCGGSGSPARAADFSIRGDAEALGLQARDRGETGVSRAGGGSVTEDMDFRT